MVDTSHRTARGIVVPAHALSWQFDRASGPGGQHVNKTSSKATLHLDLAAVEASDPVRARVEAALGPVLTITESSSRSQWRNRQLALQRALDELDRVSAPPAPSRRPTRPSRAADLRRLTAKRERSRRLRERGAASDD